MISERLEIHEVSHAIAQGYFLKRHFLAIETAQGIRQNSVLELMI